MSDMFGCYLTLFYGEAQAADDATDFLGLRVEVVKRWLIELASSKRDVALGAEFSARSRGNDQEVVKVARTPTFVPFGDVGHDRDSRAL
jgi:hypothetical protein